jgi:UDP-glucose 4-epimerase
VKRVLVTGGAGFIGSVVVDRLRAAGYEPRIFDLRPSPHHARGEVDTAIGNLLRPRDLRRAMEGCDFVVHMAAAADVGEVADDPAAAEEINSRGTLNVLQAARDTGIGRVVYASTIWVYSDVDADRVDEDTPLMPPAHLYSATKLAGEMYCRSYAELYGLEYTILRFGIPYGPRARPAAVVPIFVRKALNGEPLTVAGGGAQSRRFVFVEDLADGVVAGLQPVAANRTYNLVSDEDTTILDIASTVQSLVGDVEIQHVEGRSGDFKGAVVDGSRAETELGWRAETPFREGVRRYIAWNREQEQAVARKPRRFAPVGTLTSAARNVVALVLAAIVGMAAAGFTTVNSLDDPADRATFVALSMVMMMPLALVANIDWENGRRRAMRNAAALVAVGTAAALMLPLPAHLARLVSTHQLSFFVFVLCVIAIWVLARRFTRASRESAPDSAT